MLTLISYDIVDDKRRTKLAKKLCDFGKRVQFSVFECDLNQEQIQKVMKAIKPLINKKEDSVRIYRICQSCCAAIISIGIKKGWEEDDVIVL